MPEKYYLDTCIRRDFYEDRTSKTGLPFGRYASELFTRIMERKYKILFSEALVWELKKDYNEKDIIDMLNLLFISKVLIKVDIKKEEHF